MINTIRQHNDGFAALLFLQDLVGRKKNGVVQQSSLAPSAAVSAVSRISASLLVALRRFLQVLQFRDELLTGGGYVLEQFHFVVEVDEKGRIFSFAQHGIHKGATAGFFLIERLQLAAAGIHKQTK